MMTVHLCSIMLSNEEKLEKVKTLSSFADAVLFNKEEQVNNVQFLHNIENN